MNFPRLDKITEDLVCKRVKVAIEGFSGYFYGAVDKKTNLPSGLGVHVNDREFTVGPAKGHDWQAGRRVTFCRNQRVFNLINRKICPDGTHTRKIEVIKSVNEQNWVFGVARYFYSGGTVDNIGIEGVPIPRLFNFKINPDNWL